ncbi:MAG TPA: hypothetical protein VHV08_17355, partial [Pirellulales bacterium]|nr:hypothetical protein [Pirellulales bacterium]
NICLPNLVLKLAPSTEKSAYVAAGDALASLFHSVATLAGGAVFDWLRDASPDPSAEPYRSCVILLTAGVSMRFFGVALLAAIDEPGAWTWREIIGAAHRPMSESSALLPDL